MKAVALIVHYAARALAILLAVALSLFIGEAFDPAYGWQSGVMHAIIAGIAFGLAFLGHKKPKIGGWLYVGLGLGFLTMILTTSPMAKAGPSQFWQLFITMNPLVLFLCGIGTLFLLDAWLTRRFKTKDGK
jgi:hypothetical protein